VTLQRHVLQANSCHLKSERAWAISLTPHLRSKQKCAARPVRRPRCGGWQERMCMEQGINLMHLTCADRWEKTWPIKKSNLLRCPLKGCPSTLMSFCKFCNYTEWWWCVKAKTLHSIMSRNVPKVSLFLNRTQLNAPLPLLAAHVATPDGTHQESMCKTNQPPCQLMRPWKINIIESKDSKQTPFSLYWL